MSEKRTRSTVRYAIAWVPMPFIAIANGALREFTFGRAMSELRAHQLSTAIGSVLIGLFIYAVIRRWPPSTVKQALAIGVTWLLLTVLFEFAFGRLVSNRSWILRLNDYDLFEGRVWVLFLAWLTISPYVFFRMQDAAGPRAEADGPPVSRRAPAAEAERQAGGNVVARSNENCRCREESN